MAKKKKPQIAKPAVAQAANHPAGSAAHHWTFFTNHAHVLIVLHADPESVLREVASKVGITERAVQRIVQELEEQGYLIRERIGRRNRYQVAKDLPLRHPVEAHRSIGDLLRLMTKPS